jgi:hypothetical protein
MAVPQEMRVGIRSCIATVQMRQIRWDQDDRDPIRSDRSDRTRSHRTRQYVLMQWQTGRQGGQSVKKSAARPAQKQRLMMQGVQDGVPSAAVRAERGKQAGVRAEGQPEGDEGKLPVWGQNGILATSTCHACGQGRERGRFRFRGQGNASSCRERLYSSDRSKQSKRKIKRSRQCGELPNGDSTHQSISWPQVWKSVRRMKVSVSHACTLTSRLHQIQKGARGGGQGM